LLPVVWARLCLPTAQRHKIANLYPVYRFFSKKAKRKVILYSNDRNLCNKCMVHQIDAYGSTDQRQLNKMIENAPVRLVHSAEQTLSVIDSVGSSWNSAALDRYRNKQKEAIPSKPPAESLYDAMEIDDDFVRPVPRSSLDSIHAYHHRSY
jgi:hypothetical protein